MKKLILVIAISSTSVIAADKVSDVQTIRDSYNVDKTCTLDVDASNDNSAVLGDQIGLTVTSNTGGSKHKVTFSNIQGIENGKIVDAKKTTLPGNALEVKNGIKTYVSFAGDKLSTAGPHVATATATAKCN